MGAFEDITYAGSGTPYVQARRDSDAYVANDADSFEAFDNSRLAHYSLVVVGKGGDLFRFTPPDWLPAGDYKFIFREQPTGAGAPATDDLILKIVARHWDGAAMSDSSTVDLSPYALTTLDAVKRYMGITVATYDTLLTELINGVSAQMERVTGRAFVARDYRDRINLDRQPRIVLPNWPVQYITRIARGWATTLTVTYTGSAIRANVSVYRDPESADAGGVRLVTVNSLGVTTATNMPFGTYQSTSAMATAISLLSGWAATVVINAPSADMNPSGSENALNRLVSLNYADYDLDGWTVDPKGIIKLDRSFWFAWRDCDPADHVGEAGSTWGRHQHQGLLIQYRAGYETVPTDIDLLARDLVKEFFALRKQNTTVQMQKLGPYQVQFNGTQEERVRSRLSMYIDRARMIGGAR